MNFSNFYSKLFEAESYKFNSSQLDFNYSELGYKLYDFGLKNIHDANLANYDGRQMSDDIHVTVLYGIHNNDFNEFKKVVKDSGIKKIKLQLGKVKKFVKDENVDVIYVEVIPDYNLVALRGFLKNNLENTQTHDTYTPHVTLAFVKSNSCDHLLNDDTFNGRECSFEHITFSNKNGEKQNYYFYNTLMNENAPSTVAPSSVATGQFPAKLSAEDSKKKKIYDKIKKNLDNDNRYISQENFDSKEFNMGLNEEIKFTKDEMMAKEIVASILLDEPKFYSRKKLYGESVNPQDVNKYAMAKQKMLVHQSHGIWKDPHGVSHSWNGSTFVKVDDGKTKEVADHLRTKGYNVQHHKDNILVSKKKDHVSKDDIDKHLEKHFKDKKFKSSNLKTNDSEGNSYNSVMIKHLNG